MNMKSGAKRRNVLTVSVKLSSDIEVAKNSKLKIKLFKSVTIYAMKCFCSNKHSKIKIERKF